MAAFSLSPRIFSLLICSHVDRDDVTGGWRLNPISHLAVHSLPVPLDLVLVANVMAPPGAYDIQFNIFHAGEAKPTPLTTRTRIAVPPDKNIEYMARVSFTLRTQGLYLIEARLDDGEAYYSPIRITPTFSEAIDAAPSADGQA
ncbi:MAG: hypothetical protein IT323_14710 [Anaerolineae bacterium]|nr:hypothetical protein [Anaerolineae bacterium]